MTVGVLMLTGGFTILLLAIYVATATALWALLVVLVVLGGLVSSPPQGDTGAPDDLSRCEIQA
jgi:hypothetical protein